VKKDLAASIRARLLNLAKQEGSDFSNVLVRFALERFLYRLSQSPYSDQFLLKGALLFTLWYDMPHRPTRDVDLLGFGRSDLAGVESTFREIVSIDVEDGIVFDPDSVQVNEIRKEAGYGGARVIVSAELAGARSKTQIDIGFGDAVTPAPVGRSFPVMLSDLPAPELKTYPLYSVIAEKLHAITVLGMTNSRVKDYFDLFVLLERDSFNDEILSDALVATFNRRETEVPNNIPAGLTTEFSGDSTRRALWNAFLRKNDLNELSLDLVTETIARRILPAWLRALEIQSKFK
jgi:predicted nucleotidyltransferase component of viral defense system